MNNKAGKDLALALLGIGMLGAGLYLFFKSIGLEIAEYAGFGLLGPCLQPAPCPPICSPANSRLLSPLNLWNTDCWLAPCGCRSSLCGSEGLWVKMSAPPGQCRQNEMLTHCTLCRISEMKSESWCQLQKGVHPGLATNGIVGASVMEKTQQAGCSW